MIGSVLCDALMYRNEKLGSDIKILALCEKRRAGKKRFEKYSDSKNFKFIEGDINKPLEFHEKFDYMFHCASNTHPRDYAADPIGTVLTGVVGTKNALDYAVLCGAKRSVFCRASKYTAKTGGDTDKFSEDYLGYIDCNTPACGLSRGQACRRGSLPGVYRKIRYGHCNSPHLPCIWTEYAQNRQQGSCPVYQKGCGL